ncbi:SDR family oxidoreductase [Nocardia paucivorans]|uniref:SDR family oxidoreductase n=1 Tax=Nocardia paucivorans TaxID=114259 RepID=UPI0002E299AB|nr:SDR family NAD(P)-dependent oxidoreductase [Nocardia paucivorans]
MELEAGQVAVVTGAANGIGRALATALAGRGLRVVLADIDAEPLERLAGEIGEPTLAIPTDVADLDQVRRLADRTLEVFGRVDLLVNNAGITTGGPCWEIDPAQWRRLWSVNVEGVVNGIHVFVPHLIAAGRGHIVNTSSLAGLTTGPFGAPYSSSKHAVLSISEALHAELELLAPEVHVTVVCPGPVDTRMMRDLIDGVADSRARNDATRALPPELAEKLAPLAQHVEEMAKDLVSTERAAEIIIAAIESNQIYVTTHPEMAQAARTRTETILASFGTSAAVGREPSRSGSTPQVG